MSETGNENVSESVSPKTPRSITRVVLLLVVPVLVVVGVFIIYLKGGRYVETDNAYVKADVIPISAELNGVIAEMAVRENQEVNAGDFLFALDPEPYEVAVQRSKAQLSQVRTELAALQSSYEEKQAEIVMARSNHEFAKRELQRQIDLKGKNFVSESTLDDLQHRVEVSNQQLRVLQLDLQRIAASLGGDATRPLEEHPAYLTALADLRKAKLDLSHVQVFAPTSGIVSKTPKVGQYVRSGNAVMALVANANIWIEANFTETDLTHVRPGQRVAVHIDTYPERRWQGTVDSLSPATGAEFAIIPPQNATGNWVKIAQRVPVRIRVELPDDAPPLRSGLSTVVEIDTQYERHISDLWK